MYLFIRSIALLGMVLIHPCISTLLPFFCSIPEEHDYYYYYFEMISGQISYSLRLVTKEYWGLETPKAHLMNTWFFVFPTTVTVLVMFGNSVAVAVKLLRRPPILTNGNNNRNNNNDNSSSNNNRNNGNNNSRNSNTSALRRSSITILILATVFLVTYIPTCFIRIVDASNSYESLNLQKPGVLFYLAPSCYVVQYLSSAIDPLVYHLRGKSIFEN